VERWPECAENTRLLIIWDWTFGTLKGALRLLDVDDPLLAALPLLEETYTGPAFVQEVFQERLFHISRYRKNWG
jgi:hypothetical protein